MSRYSNPYDSPRSNPALKEDFLKDEQYDHNEFDQIELDTRKNTQENENVKTNDHSPIVNKLDIMNLNNGWNDKNERIVISLGENSASYKWMHEKSSSFYKIIHQILTILLIILNTGLSAETLLPTDSTSNTIIILRQIFIYIVTVLSVILSFLKFEKLSSEHFNSATAFNKLYHDIQQQMCLYRRDRSHAQKYISELLKTYDSLIISSPDINPIIIKRFKDLFKNSDISIPDIADRIQKIELISEQNDNKSNNPNIKTRGLEKIVIDDNKTDTSLKSKAHLNICNLDQIHNIFQIGGDITDNDIQAMNKKELDELKFKITNDKSSYEYNRFLQHTDEND